MSNAPQLGTDRPGKPGTNPQGICDSMCFAPAILLGLAGLALGVWLGQLGGKWDPTAGWTAVVATATIVSVGVGVWQAQQSARYRNTIQKQFDLQHSQFRLQREQFGLQEAQFRDYMRPLLAWDQCIRTAKRDRWIIVVRNIGRRPVWVSQVTLEGCSDDERLRDLYEGPVNPYGAAIVARPLAGGEKGRRKLTVSYRDDQGKSYELSGAITDVWASCQPRQRVSDSPSAGPASIR